MALNVNRSRLAALTREMWRSWRETREKWQDAKAAEFQRDHLEDLVAAVDNSLEQIEDLDKVLKRIKKDCE